jgi:cytochrome c-type biogenesis protein CcmH/NrfF
MKRLAAILSLATLSPLALAVTSPLALVAAAPNALAAEPTAAGPAAAGEAGPSWSGELIDELMSPYCPGRTLRTCPSSQAGELIAWIEAQEAQGRDRDEVYRQLISEFGEEIRQAPQARGFGAAAYVVPVLAFLAGGALVAAFLRRQGGGASESRPTPAALDPELERLVDEELGRPS